MEERSRISGETKTLKGAKSSKQAGGNDHARERLCAWQGNELSQRWSGHEQRCLLNEPTEVAEIDQQVGEGDISSSPV